MRSMESALDCGWGDEELSLGLLTEAMWPQPRLGDEMALPSREQGYSWALGEYLLQTAQTVAQGHTDLVKKQRNVALVSKYSGKKMP